MKFILNNTKEEYHKNNEFNLTYTGHCINRISQFKVQIQ